MVINWSPLEKVLYTKPKSLVGQQNDGVPSKFLLKVLKLNHSFQEACYTHPQHDVLSVRTWKDSPTLLLPRYLITREKLDPENDAVPSEFLPKISNLNATLIFNMPWCFRIHGKTILLLYCTMYLVTARWVHDEWDICKWHSLGRSSCMGPKDMSGDTGILCHCL